MLFLLRRIVISILLLLLLLLTIIIITLMLQIKTNHKISNTNTNSTQLGTIAATTIISYTCCHKNNKKKNSRSGTRNTSNSNHNNKATEDLKLQLSVGALSHPGERGGCSAGLPRQLGHVSLGQKLRHLAHANFASCLMSFRCSKL